MQRKLTLAKNSYLWEEGDQARNIAIVEKGKLAVRTDDGIVGVVLPKMVVGEGALNSGWVTDDETETGTGTGIGALLRQSPSRTTPSLSNMLRRASKKPSTTVKRPSASRFSLPSWVRHRATCSSSSLRKTSIP